MLETPRIRKLECGAKISTASNQAQAESEYDDAGSVDNLASWPMDLNNF